MNHDFFITFYDKTILFLYKKVLDFLIKGLMNVLNLTVTLGHDKKTIVDLKDLKDLKDIKTFSAKIVI